MSEGREVRKTFAARADLLERLAEVAKSKGVTLYAYVNQLFEFALEVESRGADFRRVFEEWEALSRARGYGLTLVPAPLWRDLVEEVYEGGGELLITKSREVGEWIAKRLTLSGGGNALGELERVLKMLSLESPELSLEASSESVRVRVVNPRLSKALAEALAALIEGVLMGLGYTRIVKDVSPGLVMIEALRGYDAGAQR